MARCALLDGDMVSNVILYDGEALYPLEAIPVVNEVGIGWECGQDGVFIAPVVESPPAPDDPTEALRASAMLKLVAGAPLTQDEACAIAGVPNPSNGGGNGNNGNGNGNGTTPAATGRKA